MTKHPVIKFLLRLAAFGILLLVLDQALGYAFKTVYFHQRVGQFSQTTYAVDSAAQDIMVFGSSRAVRHYASPVIAEALGLGCYNAGRDGQMIPYAAAVQEIALNRHTPKLVVLDINPWELAPNPSKYEKLSILLPYTDHHKELGPYIDEISSFERHKLFSKVYPYNSSVFILATNALFPKSAKKDENGYLPLEGTMTEAQLNTYQTGMEARYEKIKLKKELPDEKAIGYYKKFLDNAARLRVPVLVVISPTILKDPFWLDNQAEEKQLAISIAKQYPNIHFLDYSSDPAFNNHPEKFSDVFHLNKKGAEEFSAGFAKYIKENHLTQQ